MRFKETKILLLCLVVIAACDPRSQNYSNIPSITFENYEKIGQDSAVKLTISYLDGNGDLGLKEGMTEPPFDTGSKYYNNMFITYYEKIDGEFQQVTVDRFSTDTISYAYRFPYLTPEGRNKSIKGEISATLEIVPTVEFAPERNYNGEIKFDIYIVDRELNKSNTVSSPPIPFKADN